jgi:SAM-dependent methyltransferase
MKIDIGAPSEYGVSGVDIRINKLRAIQEIPYGVNLDLGTGIGAYYPAIKKHSKSLYAFDGEISYLKNFYKINPDDNDKIFISATENIAAKSELFDAVFAIEVLEHVNDLQQTLNEINRILKPNGFFYITVPNKYFPLDGHMVHFGKYFIKGRYVPFLPMFDFIHEKIGTARRFAPKDFYKNFVEHGFEVVGVDYMMPPFDYFNFGRKYIKKLSDSLETSFLKIFSMTLIVVLKKN